MRAKKGVRRKVCATPPGNAHLQVVRSSKEVSAPPDPVGRVERPYSFSPHMSSFYYSPLIIINIELSYQHASSMNVLNIISDYTYAQIAL